jgi:hypothetical protein
MSGIVARHGVKRKPRRTPAGNGILLRMDDDDEEDDDDESEVEAEVDDGGDPAQGKATKKKQAPSPHLRTLAEGGKQLLKLLSSANLKADKAAGSHSRSDAAIVERRRRIRPKHTAICTPPAFFSSSESRVDLRWQSITYTFLGRYSSRVQGTVAIEEETNTGELVFW